MPEVTFVATHALPAIDPTVRGTFGGTETRAWTFARALARRPNWKVNFAVRPQPRQREFDGVQIVRLRNPLYEVRHHVGLHLERQRRFPFLRLIRWSWHLLWELPLLLVTRPFRQRDAQRWCAPQDFLKLPGDVLLAFGVHVDSARTIAAGKATGRPTVVFLGADSDVDERYATDPGYVSPYGNRSSICRRVLSEADAVVAQTQRQADLLQTRFGRTATVIANPIDDVAWELQAQQPLPVQLRQLAETGYVLWVGRADRFHKRALLCLELALRCPKIPFVMVLNPREPDVQDEILRRRPANLHIVPQVAFDQMAPLFRHARVFLSTSSSELEGFPNTFLQAAIFSVPVYSLECGGDFLRQYETGASFDGNMIRLEQALQYVWESTPKTKQQRNASRERLLRDYGASSKADELMNLIQSVLDKQQAHNS